MTHYEFHPAANIFPMMDQHQRDELGRDIEEHGLHVPIILYNGQILDGRNRYTVCQTIGVEPRYTEVLDGEISDPVAYVMSKNLHRRHLTTSQKALIAARAQDYYRAAAKEKQKLAGGDKKSALARSKSAVRKNTKSAPPVHSNEQAAESIGVSPRSVDTATRVLKHGSDEVVDAIEKGELSVYTAEQVLGLPKNKQYQALQAGKKSPKKVMKHFNKSRKHVMLEHLDKALSLMKVQMVTHLDVSALRHELKTVRAIISELTPYDHRKA
jgi:ParB-like chromosome segregation protein Spo0J